MRSRTKHDWWRYRRFFWMVIGFVLGIWMAIVVGGWIIHFMSGADV
jgi:hypothetical protein